MKYNQKNISKLISKLLIFFLVILIIPSCLTSNEPIHNHINTEDYLNLELPFFNATEQIIEHTGFTLSYNETHEQASWVAYELTKEEVYGTIPRKDSFKVDPIVKTGSATLADYKSSGYDRGHLIPAADLSWSVEAMSDSFYLSNMSPQNSSLNRGMWATLESIVRQMAIDNEKVYVVTGPVLTDGPYESIGENKVSIQKHYYKVILDYTEPDIKAIGFVLPNSKPTGKIKDYIVSVDLVEELTGIDFYPSLPDEIEELIEGNLKIHSWNL